MKEPQTVSDDKGNIYIVPGQMTREEAIEYFGELPDFPRRACSTQMKCAEHASNE